MRYLGPCALLLSLIGTIMGGCGGPAQPGGDSTGDPNDTGTVALTDRKSVV